MTDQNLETLVAAATPRTLKNRKPKAAKSEGEATTSVEVVHETKSTRTTKKATYTKVKVKKHPLAKLPAYQTPQAAGMDVSANIMYPKWLESGQIETIPTGLFVSIPEGYYLEVKPRSGLASKGITCHLGTIDADYRGEIQVILMNLGKDKFQVNKGDRIAQLVLKKLEQVSWEVVDQLDETERGEGGLGSTGV